MSSLPSINEEHHLKRVYTPVRAQNSGDAPYANCPDSIMKIMNKENSSASKVNEDMSSPSASYNEWENELFGHGKCGVLHMLHILLSRISMCLRIF